MTHAIDLRRDTLDVALFVPDSPLARGADGMAEVLKAIDAHAGPLAPDQFFNKKVVAYAHPAVLRAVTAKLRSPKVIVDLIRSADPEVSFSLDFVHEGPVRFVVRVTIPMSWVAERADERSAAVVRLVRGLASAFPPAYGYAHSKTDLQAADEPHVVDPAAPVEPREAYWLNVLGREVVERIGSERAQSAPAAARESLPGGGLLLLTRPTPVDWVGDEARQAQARALAHLTGADPAAVLARLRARSARLAPVERRFDPDVAPLIERLIDAAGISNRAAETERWNAYRPPAPSEWRPAAEQPPSDVEDQEAAIDRYQSLWTEQLIALVHPYASSVARAEPDSLPDVDAHFYHGDYTGLFDRERIEKHLVPAAGAYLGTLMVRALGGRWIPRRDLDETAVVVGDRAWLPFLRARHLLRTKQDAVDHSLTQLFRAAARIAKTPA